MKEPPHCFRNFSSEYLGDRWENSYLCTTFALVAKLVDAPDLGSGVLRRVGSSPIGRTNRERRVSSSIFYHNVLGVPSLSFFFAAVE